jgi:hypothetical protein
LVIPTCRYMGVASRELVDFIPSPRSAPRWAGKRKTALCYACWMSRAKILPLQIIPHHQVHRCLSLCICGYVPLGLRACIKMNFMLRLVGRVSPCAPASGWHGTARRGLTRPTCNGPFVTRAKIMSKKKIKIWTGRQGVVSFLVTPLV